MSNTQSSKAETELADIPTPEGDGIIGSTPESQSDASLEETDGSDSESEGFASSEGDYSESSELGDTGRPPLANSSGEYIAEFVPPFHGTPPLWTHDRTVPEMAFGFIFGPKERRIWAIEHNITRKKYKHPEWEAGERVRRRLLPAIHRQHLPVLALRRQEVPVLIDDFFSDCVVVGTNKTEAEMEKTKDVELIKKIAELIGQTQNEPKWYYIDVDHKWS